MRGQRIALRGPFGQARALLLDDRRRRVVHERFAGQLGRRLREFRFDALEFLVQARALRTEVDQAFQRHEQLHLADEARGRRRRLALDHADALDAIEEAQLRIEPAIPG